MNLFVISVLQASIYWFPDNKRASLFDPNATRHKESESCSPEAMWSSATEVIRSSWRCQGGKLLSLPSFRWKVWGPKQNHVQIKLLQTLSALNNMLSLKHTLHFHVALWKQRVSYKFLFTRRGSISDKLRSLLWTFNCSCYGNDLHGNGSEMKASDRDTFLLMRERSSLYNWKMLNNW